MLVLADTSVWVDHLRRTNSLFAGLLEKSVILMHPCVLGELALGNLKNRGEILHFLADLPQALAARDDEVLHTIGSNQLWGQGIGWIDAHLLASALLTPGCALWTLDNALRMAAGKSGAKLLDG